MHLVRTELQIDQSSTKFSLVLLIQSSLGMSSKHNFVSSFQKVWHLPLIILWWKVLKAPHRINIC